MMFNLMDTTIPDLFSTGLYQEMGYDVDKSTAPMILDIAVTGTTEILADCKNKDIPVAVVFDKPNGDFIAAAVVQYFPNEDKSNPGNWNYSWTFNENDLADNSKKFTPFDSKLSCFYVGAASSKYGLAAKQPSMIAQTMNYIIQLIKKWLDENASEKEEQGVKLDNIIQFRVAIENGEKVFSAEPDGEIKQLIKDDASIEK